MTSAVNLLYCRWADFGDRCFLCVPASFARRQEYHVQPVIAATVQRQGGSGQMDQGSNGAVAGDQRERERGSPAGCILTLAVNSGFNVVVNLSERTFRAQSRIRSRPECARDALTPSLYIGDRAVTVVD
jgi:hypothetical protein